MNDWQVIESGSLAPDVIMAKDAALLAQLDPQGPSLLHFYDWNGPCLTYGYFADPHRYLNMEALQNYGLQMARRPTGGGIIFHLSDLSFSVLLSARHPHFSLNTLDNYAFINQKVAEAITCLTSHMIQPQLLSQEILCLSQECHAFCMAKPTQYDLIVEGRKMGGAAQRRKKQGLLHQTSLSLILPPLDLIREVLKNGESVVEAMQQHSVALFSKQTSCSNLPLIKSQFKKLLCSVFI